MNYKKHVEGLCRGSYSDFKHLYDAFAGNLYGFVLGLTHSPEKSKEIVQDTFVKIWCKRESIKPDMSFKSYLFKISQNIIIDEFRRCLNNPLFESLENCDQADKNDIGVEQIMDFNILYNKLETIKSKLSPRQREIFELNKEYGLSPGDIAKKINISEQTVYNQLSTALRIIRKEMGSSFVAFFLLLLSQLFFFIKS